MLDIYFARILRPVLLCTSLTLLAQTTDQLYAEVPTYLHDSGFIRSNAGGGDGAPTTLGVYAVAVVAVKKGGGISGPTYARADTFNVTVQPDTPTGKPLEITATYNCGGTVTFKPVEGTGNGYPITYSSDELTNIQLFEATATLPASGGYGTVKPELLTNPRPITIRATQPNSSYVASFTANFVEQCLLRFNAPFQDVVYTLSPDITFSYNLSRYVDRPAGVAGPFNPRYDVTGLPAGLSLSSFYGSGQQTTVFISGKPTITGVFSVTVTVTNDQANTPPISGTFTITIKPAEGTGNPGNPTNPSSTTGNLAVAKAIPDQRGTVNQPFRFSVPAGTFSGPVSRIDVSDLPRGLMYLSDSYTIMGTVSGADQRYVTVTAFDAQGNRVQTTFLLGFSSGSGDPGSGNPTNPTKPGGGTGALAVAQPIPPQSSPIGQPFRFSIPAGTFSGPVARIDVSDLPRGLMYLSDSYTIMGTVSGADQRYITVTAFDAQGNRVQAGFLLSFTSEPGNPGNPGGGTSTGSLAVAQSIPDQSGRVGQFFTFSIPAATFSGPVTHVDVSDLPRGLMYLSDTRTIRGTVSEADQRRLTVTAQDGAGNSVRTTFTLSFGNASARLGVQEREVQLQAQLYPNPVQHELVVRIVNAQDQDVQLAISDLSGRVVARRSLRVVTPVHEEHIPVPGLASGLYLLRVNTAQQTLSLKLNKQ